MRPAGRLLIAQGAVDACKTGVSIAIRYSCKRPQFGEKMIMEYITQQRRLLPGLATTYAMQIAMRRLRVRLLSCDSCCGMTDLPCRLCLAVVRRMYLKFCCAAAASTKCKLHNYVIMT